jgi:uncharacterized protein involved in outer membrane biogenesis
LGRLAVQTTLLGLGLAIILALVAALVAPLVVDWRHYRSAFEQEATRLVGLPVRVNGAIDARILPTPRIELRDVEVGQAGRPPQVRAATVELELGLGSLLRGEVRATELHLVAPQINLALDRSGAIDWPALSPSFRADALTISRLNVEDGHVILADAASGARVTLQKLWFNGEIRSFIGPFHGEGAFVVGNELYGYRISGSRFEDGGLRLKLGVDPSNHPLTTEIEGTLSFDHSLPQFEGTLALTRPVGVTLARGERVMNEPWQLTGKIRGTSTSATLQDLALQYGPEERAVNLSGRAELTFGEHPRLDGNISARQVDVDRALANPDVTHRPPLIMIKSFFEAFVATVKPSLPGAVGLAFDALTVGGTTLQSLHGTVRFDGKSWGFDDFAFRAPGFTEVSLSGQLDNGPQGLSFTGPAKLESPDLKTLMAWLEGRKDPPSGPNETFSARGVITIASDRFMLDRLSAALDRESMQGRLAYTWASADRPATVDGELEAATLNLDALAAFVKAALSDSALEIPRRVALVLDVGKATFAGVDARMVNAKVKFDAGIVHIDRLSIGDLGGGALDISGRIDELSSQPRGRITLDLDARTLAGLTDIVGRLAPQVAAVFRPFNDHLAPAKVHAVLTVDRANGGSSAAKFELGGDLGATRVTLNGDATGDPTHPGATVVRMTGRLDADDGGALVQLFNLDRVLAVDQLPGQLTLSASGALDGAVRVNGVAAAGGFSAAVDGALHLNGGQTPTGSFQIKAAAADLRPLHRWMTGQPATATTTTASAIVGFAGADVALTDLIVGAGKSSVRGRLELKLASPFGISGDIAADEVDGAAASAMLFGMPSAAPASTAAWSHEPIGAGAFGVANGAVTFKLDRAALTPAWVARDLKGVVRLQPAQIALSDLDGNFADGRITGDIAVSHEAEDFALRGHVELAGANAAKVLGPGKSVDGLLTVKLQGEGLGASPEALVGSLHGGGTISLGEGSFAGIDAAAFDAAIRAADLSSAIALPKIRAAVSAAVDNGRLVVPQTNADVTIAAGQIHLADTTVNAQDGAKLSLDGILDLNNLAIDSHMTLSGQPAANALIPTRPEFAIAVKGPLAAPERRLDVSTLVAWLTLRAAELQTRRLELIEANRRDEVLGPVFRPTPSAIRFIPTGTVLEATEHADALAGTTPGSRAFERLRLGGSSAVPPIQSDSGAGLAPPTSTAMPRPATDNATAAAGTTQPDRRRAKAPPPAIHSPLDLLFGSQD